MSKYIKHSRGPKIEPWGLNSTSHRLKSFFLDIIDLNVLYSICKIIVEPVEITAPNIIKF